VLPARLLLLRIAPTGSSLPLPRRPAAAVTDIEVHGRGGSASFCGPPCSCSLSELSGKAVEARAKSKPLCEVPVPFLRAASHFLVSIGVVDADLKLKLDGVVMLAAEGDSFPVMLLLTS
jgi:hypothetical protein